MPVDIVKWFVDHYGSEHDALIAREVFKDNGRRQYASLKYFVQRAPENLRYFRDWSLPSNLARECVAQGMTRKLAPSSDTILLYSDSEFDEILGQQPPQCIWAAIIRGRFVEPRDLALMFADQKGIVDGYLARQTPEYQAEYRRILE